MQAESFYHRLQKNVKTRELVDQAARLEKISATNRRKIDKMCRNCFLDPRGFYSKSMMGFVEDAEILLQSSFMPEVKETALKREISKIIRYQKELYGHLLELARELKWYDLSKELSMMIEPELEAIGG